MRDKARTEIYEFFVSPAGLLHTSMHVQCMKSGVAACTPVIVRPAAELPYCCKLSTKVEDTGVREGVRVYEREKRQCRTPSPEKAMLPGSSPVSSLE